MPIKATTVGGDLQPLGNCTLTVAGMNFDLYILPDFSESKAAEYNDEVIIGRATPIKTYSHSANRSISATFVLLVRKTADIQANLKFLRAIQAGVYPRLPAAGAPYVPPRLCKLQCGELFKDVGSGGGGSKPYVCCALKDYSIKYPTDVPWDEATKLPYRLEVSCNFDVVYKSEDLPGQENILALA